MHTNNLQKGIGTLFLITSVVVVVALGGVSYFLLTSPVEPNPIDKDEDEVMKKEPQEESATCRVTGCSSQICADQEVITTCEYREEYACYKNAQCERQADGGCGWSPPAEVNSCLESYQTASFDISEIMEEKPDAGPVTFSGTVLAGSTAPLLEFNQADYEKALQSKELVVLYFFANWCPICLAEIPHLYGAFNELDSDKVIGFRVSYRDNETDNSEEDIARSFGVAYQHTKVFIKNGERILKSPSTWDKNRYISEINKAL